MLEAAGRGLSSRRFLKRYRSAAIMIQSLAKQQHALRCSKLPSARCQWAAVFIQAQLRGSLARCMLQRAAAEATAAAEAATAEAAAAKTAAAEAAAVETAAAEAAAA